MTVKATGASESGIKYVHAVGGTQDYDTLRRGEAIHLDQQLVEGLVLLHFTATTSGIAFASCGIDLINEDNAGSLRACLLEQGAYTASTNPYKHLDELGAGGCKEGHACLSSNCLCQQSLACARVAYEQYTARHP